MDKPSFFLGYATTTEDISRESLDRAKEGSLEHRKAVSLSTHVLGHADRLAAARSGKLGKADESFDFSGGSCSLRTGTSKEDSKKVESLYKKHLAAASCSDSCDSPASSASSISLDGEEDLYESFSDNEENPLSEGEDSSLEGEMFTLDM